MVRKSLFGLGALVVAIIVMLKLTGCSVIGFGIGAISDDSKPDRTNVPGWQIATVKPGTSIDVILTDGNLVSGKYKGLSKLPQEEYAELYNKFQVEQKVEGVILPALGDTLRITAGLQEVKAQFSGFDRENIMWVTMKEGASGSINIDTIKRLVDSDGIEVDKETIKKLFSAGKIPVLSAMIVESEAETNLIGLSKVNLIQIRTKKNDKWTGLLIGAVVDVLVIAVTSQPERESTASEEGQGSCPFIYSFDGENYIFDSETFGGAIFKAAQRTDWDNLDHLCEAQGKYRLKIANELPETQYLDQLKLLVIDHPKGTNVAPTFSGEFHVLSNPQAPIKAIDFCGNQVLGLVKEKDDQFWISNPYGRDPAIRDQVRDGLLLDFARPDSASFVKLNFNVQNTHWATFIESQLLKLYGNKLDNWYDLMSRSAKAREAFKKSVIREAMLLIKLWNGTSWEDADYLWFVGPYLPKDQVVGLDIKNIPGEVLRVRLESTAGLWMVNSVQADFTPDQPIHVQEIAPDSAMDNNGIDLRPVLCNIDGQYYVTSTRQDHAELAFSAPATKIGYDRSVILKSTGYYTIHIAAEAPLQWKLLSSFRNKPGAFGQYTLRLLNQYVTATMAELEENGDFSNYSVEQSN